MLYGEGGETYKTAQSFWDVGQEAAYSRSFSFRVPEGAKLARLAIEGASFELATLEE